MLRNRGKSIPATMAVMLLGSLSASPALADAVADFYSGNAVTLYVGYSPGGAYDVYARAIAPFLEKHLPGNPTVVVANVPGAASLNLVNQLNSTLPADGTAIATFGRGIVIDKVVGRESTDFDAANFGWIGSISQEVSVCGIWHTTGVSSLEELLNQRLILGATAPGSETGVYPVLLNSFLGAQLEIVSGYPGASELDLAIEQEEVDGRCGWTWSAIQTGRLDWYEEGKVFIALQFALEKHEDLQDVPLIMDILETQEQRDIFELILAQQVMGRPYAAPPGVPEERLEALRAAFDATMNDPEFIAQAERQNLDLSPITGEELQELVDNILSAPPEIAEAARQVLNP